MIISPQLTNLSCLVRNKNDFYDFYLISCLSSSNSGNGENNYHNNNLKIQPQELKALFLHYFNPLLSRRLLNAPNNDVNRSARNKSGSALANLRQTEH